MVCVDREKYTCLCGCDMTVSTVVFGIVHILVGLGSLISIGALGLIGVFQIVFGIFMCGVYCQQKNIALRKCIFHAYIVYCVLEVFSLFLTIVFILVLDWSEYASENGYNEDEIRGVMIVTVLICAAISIPVTLVGLEVVYYGWKEQDEKEDKKEKKVQEKKKNAQAMPAQMV